MSWSEVFPILSDDLVSLFEAGATDKERSELDQLFAVSRVFNKSEAGHIVSTSLFWKNIHMDLPRIKISRRAQVLNPHKAGLLRFDPWEHYVEPLLKGAHWLAKNRPDAVFRVYLAGDMKFLVPDLVSAGCEVHLMKSNSLAHNPGAMWRFLALEEEGRMVTVVDADRAADPEPQMAQTEEISRLGLGWWRVPAWGELNELGNTAYRPILGCHFGGVRPFPAAHLMHALIWATRKGKIEHFANLPGRPPTRVHGSIWPDYGFDEWFLLTTLYPRAAFEGILSLVPDDAASKLLPLDIEYVQWANNTSEMVYLRSPGGGCCGGGACGEPGTPGGMEILVPKSPKRDIIAYTYLENCGLGEAAAANIEAMKALGLTVERRIWNGELINESALGDKRQVYYHHWHPQPHERNKKWSRNAFGKAYHIAFYAFETDTVPQEFHLSSKMMNELWVPSNYCRGVFEVTGKPVHVVPHAVSPAQHQLEPLPGSSGKRPLNVLFLFDAWSRLARKNPEAVVRVFQEAFPEEGEARLIIKSHHLSPGDLSKLTTVRLLQIEHQLVI